MLTSQTKASQKVGAVVIAGVSIFSLSGGGAQFLRADYNWYEAPLSFYLLGPYGEWVQAGYFCLSVAIIAFSLGMYRALAKATWRVVPLLLFFTSSIALIATALIPSDLPNRGVSTLGVAHRIAATTTFVSISLAVGFQAWCFRYHSHWRMRFPLATGLTIAIWAALYFHAASKLLPRGLTQRLAIVLIIAWLLLGAYWLMRTPSAKDTYRATPRRRQ